MPAPDGLTPTATIGTARLHTNVLTDTQLQRAWALGYATVIVDVARWINAGGTS